MKRPPTLAALAAATAALVAADNREPRSSALACNVFWQVGSSATLGTNSAVTGNILALTSITLTTGATLQGRFAWLKTGLSAAQGATLRAKLSVEVPAQPFSVATPSPSFIFGALPNGTYRARLRVDDAIEKALCELHVPLTKYHSERYSFV